MSEFRRDAAVAVSNAVTASQRLLSEPPNRRGDVETSLAAVNYCRRILHALAAISDYPARKPIQIESEELTRLIDGLAKALDSLAAIVRTGPKLSSIGLPEWLENSGKSRQKCTCRRQSKIRNTAKLWPGSFSP